MTHSELHQTASLPVGDLVTAGGAIFAQLNELVPVEVSEELACIHPDDWEAMAESAVRAARGERDHRPFTTCPELVR